MNATMDLSRHGLNSWCPHRRLQILAVDDNRDGAESLACLLRRDGYEVRTAFSGQAALVEAQESKPDVVLLDISMPRMDGYEVASRLREMFHEDVVLIAVTALGSDQNHRKFVDAGFNQYVLKPADPVRLEEMIRQLTEE